MSITAGSIESVTHPSENADRISSSVTSAWPPVTWLVVAEAEHVVAPTRGDYLGQAADILLAILVIEDVEQPTVENGVEPIIQLDQAQGVQDEEPRLEAPFGRLGLGELDGPRSDVDADGLVAQGGRQEGMLASAATDIEDLADQSAGLGKTLERRLGPSNVPRRRVVGVDGIEVVGRARRGTVRRL